MPYPEKLFLIRCNSLISFGTVRTREIVDLPSWVVLYPELPGESSLYPMPQRSRRYSET